MAVLVSTINIDSFGSLLGDDIEAFIIDENGNYIGHSKAATFASDENGDGIWSEDGTYLEVEEPEEGSDKTINLSINPITQSETDSSYKGLASLMQTMLDKGTGVAEYTSMTTGKEQYVAYSTVEQTNWRVAYLVDQDVVLQSANSLTKQLLIIAVIMIILGIIVSFFFGRALMKPLVKATDSLDDIIDGIQAGEGDLTVRLETKSRDEVGRIIHGINKYTEVLQQVTLKINEEVLNNQEVTSNLSDEIEKFKRI